MSCCSLYTSKKCSNSTLRTCRSAQCCRHFAWPSLTTWLAARTTSTAPCCLSTCSSRLPVRSQSASCISCMASCHSAGMQLADTPTAHFSKITAAMLHCDTGIARRVSIEASTQQCKPRMCKVYAGTSVMNMEHWAQGVRRPVDSTLRAMDFGTDCHNGAWPGLCNQQHYNGSAAAPAYPLEAIDTPLVLLSGAISGVISACISFACVA